MIYLVLENLQSLKRTKIRKKEMRTRLMIAKQKLKRKYGPRLTSLLNIESLI